jgi:quinol monooxygenase YgiN
MIVRIVKMTFRPEMTEDFCKVFEANRDRIRNYNGCRHLELLRDSTEQEVFFTYSHWESEQHLEAYRNSELFAEVWTVTKSLFGAKPVAWTCQSLYSS